VVVPDIREREITMTQENIEFGIVEDCGKGEWHWVQPGKFRMAVGGPGSLAYPDRASAERDAEKIRSRFPARDLTVVAATSEDKESGVISLAEGHGRLENSIWGSVNDFNKEQLSLGAPPATCDEIIKALAYAVHYVLVYLAEPDFGYAEPDEKDPPDVVRLEKIGVKYDLVDRFVELLNETFEMPTTKGRGGANGFRA
jgi:hypothetical protein